MVFYNYFLHTSLFCFLLRIKYPKTKRLNWNHHLAKKNDKPLSFSNREWVILDEVPTMVEIEIFWFQIHITNGLNSLHRKWRTGNQYRVTAVEIRMRSNLELLPVMNVKKWLKIAVCSSPLNIYHGTDNIIKQLSFLPPVRNNIFYEIETSSTGLYNTRLGAQPTWGGRPPFWRKTFKNDGKFEFGFPYLPPLLRKSGSAPSHIWYFRHSLHLHQGYKSWSGLHTIALHLSFVVFVTYRYTKRQWLSKTS
jgi:hypothetical protein